MADLIRKNFFDTAIHDSWQLRFGASLNFFRCEKGEGVGSIERFYVLPKIKDPEADTRIHGMGKKEESTQVT